MTSPLRNLAETELIKRIKAGNQRAYEVLLERHWSRVLTVSRHLRANEDWFQEAHVIVYNTAMNWDLESEEYFSTVLVRELYRAAERYRHELRKTYRNEYYNFDEYLATYSDIPAPDDEDADLKWVRYKIFQLTKKLLKPLERKVLLCEFFKLKKSGANSSTWRTNKQRAIEKLRDSEEFRQLWNQSRELF